MNSLIITCLYKGDNRCKNECTFADKLCKEHKQYLSNIDEYILINKDNCVSICNSYFKQMGLCMDLRERNKIIDKIFIELYQYRHFLYYYDRFMETVIKKLETLQLDSKYDNSIFDVNKHKILLFPHIYNQKIDYLTVEI